MPVTQQTVLLENFSQRSFPDDLQLPPSLTPEVLIENNISEFVDILEESTHAEQQKETTASDWAQQGMNSLTNAPVGGKLSCTSFVQCDMQPTPVRKVQEEGVNSSEQTPVSKNASPFTRFLTQPSSVKSKKSISPERKKITRIIDSPTTGKDSPGDTGEVRQQKRAPRSRPGLKIRLEQT